MQSTYGLLLDTFASIGIPVFLADERDNIVSLNNTVSEVFQYGAADLLGHTLWDFISRTKKIDSTRPGPLLPGLPTTQLSGLRDAVHYEASCRRKDSSIFLAQVSIIAFPQDCLKLAVIQNISDRRKLQLKASQRTKELSIFNTFANILTRDIPADRVLQETVDMLALIMETQQAWICLIEENTGVLCLKAGHGIAERSASAPDSGQPSEALNSKIIASGKPLLVENAPEDPRVSHAGKDIKSMAGVPITSKGIVMGVLGVGSRRASYFTSMDIQLLNTIGSQIGVAIENSRLIGQLKDNMSQIELINELSGIINSSLSIGTIFRMVVSEIKKLVSCDRASLLLYNEKNDNFLIFALDTEIKTLLKKGVRAPIEGTSAGWVARHNRPWISHDLRETEFPLDRKLLSEGIRSTVSIPLYHDRVLGVFNLDSTVVAKYSEKDLDILVPIAKHISIALENALLFEEISKEKKEWEKTFDAITDMVWIEDGKQRILRANRTLLSKTGFSTGEVAGMRCWDLLERIGINQTECLCATTNSTKEPSFRELRGTGRSIFYFWAYPLIDEEGQLYSIVHYLKDVTAQKQLEQQLIRSEKLASLGTLVAGIAHEINNPLGIIAGYSEALLDRSKESALLGNAEFEDFPEYLSTIHNEIFRCKGILRSLLDFARPSGGTFRELDINELIKEVILLVNHRAKRLRHNIELRLNRDLPKIYADPGNLRQLFMNLIINSIYFTPSGGSIVITSETAATGEAPDIIRVSVSDTGTGIPGAILDKIFDPFFTTKPVGDGTGLGLSICHKIVEAHNGNIDVESEEGRGTTFTIKFPAKRQHG